MNEIHQEETLSAIQIDDSLEDRLLEHGITRRNVRSIIHGIFSDENVLRLLKDADSNPGLSLPEARITRSKKCQNEMMGFDFTNRFHEWDSDMLFIPNDDVDRHADYDANTTLDSSGDHADINTESCFDENGEFNWQAWLSEFDNSTKDKSRDIDKESDSDPDYNFLAELEEQDEEDYRDDRLTKITKKELVDLTKFNKKGKKRKNSTGPIMETTVDTLDAPKKLALEPISKESKAEAVNVFFNCRTTREKLRMMRHDPALKSIVVSKKKKKIGRVKSEFLNFSKTQLKTLKLQMQQHVQLLAQTCVLGLGREDSLFMPMAFLQELELFKSESLQPDNSKFNVEMAPQAIKIAKSVESLTKSVAYAHCKRESILANSKVFMYKELLPKFIHQASSKVKKSNFSFHEDCLIAHGLNEMSGYGTSPAELISLLLLPCRSKEQINSRVKTAMRGNTRKDIQNPIVKYKMFNVLPPPYESEESIDVNIAVPPAQMEGDLPNWLSEVKMGRERLFEVQSRVLGSATKVPSKKYSARNLKKMDYGGVALFWTREMDETILSICKQYNGPSKEAMFLLSYKFPIRTAKQIENRFCQLMKMYARTLARKKSH